MKINSVKLKYKQMKRLITSSLSILIAVIFIQGSIASVHGQQKKTTGEWRLEKKGSSLNFSFKIEDKQQLLEMVNNQQVQSPGILNTPDVTA